MKAKTKSLELKKHVAAIHSTGSMTLVQRKIANGLLYNAYHELLDKEEHQISIRELCELIGYDSNDHQTIKKALINLLSTVIEWNLVDGDSIDKDGVWNASSIIADASIQGSICTYSYSKRMKQLLYMPEMYGRLNMEVQARFKSSYGLALYENCIRYQNIQQTPWFDFIKFRQLMGIEENKYPIFRDFKRRVLDKAVEEVNLYAPITIKPEIKKMQRKVVSIRFLLAQKKLCEATPTQAEESLESLLKTRYGLSKTKITSLINSYSQDYILEKMILIEASPSYKEGKIVNLAKYLESALENDFQQPVSSKQSHAAKQTGVQGEIELQKIEKKRKLLREDYNRYVSREIICLYNQLEGQGRAELDGSFKRYLRSSIHESLYYSQGLKAPVIQDEFSRFIKVNYPNLCASIISFDEYFQLNADMVSPY